jgi:hypothetical protein
VTELRVDRHHGSESREIPVDQITESGYEFQLARIQISHRAGMVMFTKFLRLMSGSKPLQAAGKAK